MRKHALVLLMLFIGAANAFGEVNVAASIKPLHSLVASVMQGVGTPALIVEGNSSPHTYNLKPADANKLQQAQVIFWIGNELEAFLEKPIESLAQDAMVVALIDVPTITKLPARESEHDEIHDQEKNAADAHIWLDPENAKKMLDLIAATLSKSDPANAATYTTNASRTAKQIEDISIQVSRDLETTHGKEFIVFHDAYQYFEVRYKLKSTAAISIHPENPPGAKQIAAIRKTIIDGKIQCVFAEPQFDNKLVNVVLEGTTAKAATLDPIGAELPAGPELYVRLLLNLAKNFSTCMG